MTGQKTDRSMTKDRSDGNTSNGSGAFRGNGEAQREDKREAIVAAAARVFKERGLDGASMRLIAREAGCTTGAIYPHFGGKESLYAEVLAQSLASLQKAIRDAVAVAPVGEQGRAGIKAFYDYYRAYPLELTLGLYLYQGARPVGLTEELDRSLNRSLQTVFNLIADGLAADGYDDTAQRTTTGVAQAVGLLILHQTRRLRLLESNVDEQMTYFLQGL